MPRVPHPLLVGADRGALDVWRRALAGAGVAVAGLVDPSEAPVRLRALRPSLLVLVAPAAVGEARTLVGRCRAAAGVVLPAILLLPPPSPWLRAPLPAELHPAIALDASEATAGDVVRVARLLAGRGRDGVAVSIRAAGLTLDPIARRLEGPAGDVFLTPSESTLLATLLRRPSEVVRVEEVAVALWGRPLGDTHARAAVRTHLHTLRRKLAVAGAPGAVRSILGVGYRLDAGGMRPD